MRREKTYSETLMGMTAGIALVALAYTGLNALAGDTPHAAFINWAILFSLSQAGFTYFASRSFLKDFEVSRNRWINRLMGMITGGLAVGFLSLPFAAVMTR